MRTITEMVLEAFRRMLLAEERSAGTIEKYLREAREFAVWLGSRSLCRELVCAWRDMQLARGLKAQTVNGKLSSVNALLRFMGREDCRARLLRVQREAFRPEERELGRAEYEKLVATAKKRGKLRLALIFETLCAAGLRVSELVYISVETVRCRKVNVYNKGKSRTVLLPKQLTVKLAEYAEAEGITSGSIFLTRSGRAIGRKQIWAEMKSICKEAGVDPRKVFPHNLRHLFAVEFYRAYKDIVKLADILGHSSINTTRRYLIGTGAEHRERIEALRLIS